MVGFQSSKICFNKPHMKITFISLYSHSQHIQTPFFFFLIQNIFKGGSAFSVFRSDFKSKFSFPLIQFFYFLRKHFMSLFVPKEVSKPNDNYL